MTENFSIFESFSAKLTCNSFKLIYFNQLYLRIVTICVTILQILAYVKNCFDVGLLEMFQISLTRCIGRIFQLYCRRVIIYSELRNSRQWLLKSVVELIQYFLIFVIAFKLTSPVSVYMSVFTRSYCYFCSHNTRFIWDSQTLVVNSATVSQNGLVVNDWRRENIFV